MAEFRRKGIYFKRKSEREKDCYCISGYKVIEFMFAITLSLAMWILIILELGDNVNSSKLQSHDVNCNWLFLPRSFWIIKFHS